MGELMDVCERALAWVPEGIDAQVTVTRGSSGLTRFANSVIHQNVAEDATSLRVRVAIDGRIASAGSNQYDEEALGRIVQSAVDAARLRPPDDRYPGLAPPAAAPDVEHYDDATAGADPDARAEVVRRFVDAGPGLAAAGYCDSGTTTVAFANSAGQRLEGRSSRATVSGIHQTATSEGAASLTSTRIADLDGASVGARAAAKARDCAEAIDIEPGQYEVVLEPECVANMLSFLAGSGFNAKAVEEGRSFVHLGEQQFDTAISLWDDATDPRSLGLPFDSEGTPKRRVDLVVDGVTQSVVHDRRTAAKAGTESTGHGGAQRDTTGPVPGNLFLAGGASSREDLIGNVARGLLVSRFNYTRILDPKTQVVTGLTRSGVFLIEDGKLGPAVKNLRFTQSYVAALGPGKVKGVGNDAQLIGPSHVPSLHLASWNFTGGARG